MFAPKNHNEREALDLKTNIRIMFLHLDEARRASCLHIVRDVEQAERIGRSILCSGCYLIPIYNLHLKTKGTREQGLTAGQPDSPLQTMRIAQTYRSLVRFCP